MQNHFELFDLPPRFAIDSLALDRAYHEVQNQVHPDKFSVSSDAEKRVAMQWATRANEAYRILKNPLKRAMYLCQLNGADLQIESNTEMPAEFLMQQMTWREALDEARANRDESALAQLDLELRTSRCTQLEQTEMLLNLGDYQTGVSAVRKLMFIEKLGDEIRNTFDQWS